MADPIPLRSPTSPAVGPMFLPTERIADLIPGGEHLSRDVTFGLDCWDLAGHPSWRDKAGTATRLDFQRFAPRWQGAAKELALIQLNPSLAKIRAAGNPMAENWPEIQEPVAPVTAQGNLKMLSHALGIVDRNGIVRFDSDEWQRLSVLLVQPVDVSDKREGAVLSAATGRGRAQQLVALWQCTIITSRTGLLGEGAPFDGKELNSVFGHRLRLNSVRPHESVGHMLGYAAWIFDNIAEDIVEHVEWWAANCADEAPLSREELREAMLDLAGELAHKSGGRLPGSRNLNGGLTLAHGVLGRLLGAYDSDEAYLAGRWVMSQLGDSVTLSEDYSPCPVPITVLPARNGPALPWTRGLMPTNLELDLWQRRLVYAAMYYLAATVMLRDSQLAMLPLDPLVVEVRTLSDGTSYEQRTLKAFKTKNRHAPVPTTVTVNARVEQVIAVLQRLQRALGYETARHSQTGLPLLFDQRIATPLGKLPRDGNRDELYLDLSFVSVMRGGAAELYERGVIGRDLADAELNMRQVRITCAQAYAVREHGQALAAAFGQWDTAAVATGYVGDVYKLITPLEPEDALDIARQDRGRRLVRAARERENLTGRGLARLEETIEAHADRLSNPAPLTLARLATLGKANPNLEQGPLTLCIYQQEGARCGGKGKADFRLCLPGQCGNSVMSPADRARYELMRRQHLVLDAPVLRRAAAKMDEANPEIRKEFESHSDQDLQRIIADHVDDYVRAALEGRP